MTPIERALLYLLDRQRTVYGELMPVAEELMRQISQTPQSVTDDWRLATSDPASWNGGKK